MPRRRPPQGLRTEVFWLLGGFVAIQLALAVVVETLRPGVRDPNFGRKLELLRARGRAAPGRPLCLALGSSRVMNGLRPADLPPPRDPGGRAVTVFNAAAPLCGPYQAYLTLERTLADGFRPRWVVVEAAPALYGQSEDVADLLPPERASLGDLGRNYPSAAAARGAYAGWARARLVPAFTYRHALLSRTLPGWVPWGSRLDYLFEKTDSDGWTRMTPIADPALREWARREDRRRFGAYARRAVSDSARAGFAGVARLAREHGLRVLVVVMPEGRELQTAYPPEQWSLYAQFTASVAAGLGAEVVDARDWMPADAFADGHHLLPDAAAAFSRRFGAEVLNPFLARP